MTTHAICGLNRIAENRNELRFAPGEFMVRRAMFMRAGVRAGAAGSNFTTAGL
jgi:hypothetical protein